MELYGIKNTNMFTSILSLVGQILSLRQTDEPGKGSSERANLSIVFQSQVFYLLLFHYFIVYPISRGRIPLSELRCLTTIFLRRDR